MTLRLVLLALAISLSPLLLSAAVQHRPPTRQAAETELRLPRKKSFFPNQHARRYHYRLLKSDQAGFIRRFGRWRTDGGPRGH